MDDFEGNGNITWKADNNVMNASFDNPASGGINTSAKVLEYSDEGGTYSNIQFDLSADTSVKYDLTTKNVFTLKVYVPTPAVAVAESKILWLKLQDGSKGANSYQGQVVSEQAYEYDVWQELTFDFSSIAINADMSRLVLQFNGENNVEHVKAYIDDISYGEAVIVDTCSNGIKDGDETGIDCGGSCGPCSAPPTTAPTAPPARNAADVISLYSEAYTNVASNFDAGWCGAAIKEVSIAGNNVQAFIGDNCQGIVLNAGIDASAFTNLHVDVYIEEGVDLTSKVFNLKFVQQPGGAAIEVNFNAASSPALVAGSWIAIDVVVDLSTLTGFKEFGITAGTLKNQVWYDNLYIHKGTALSVGDNELLNVSMYPNPTASKLNISAASPIKNVSIFNLIGRKVMGLNIDSNSAAIDVSGLSSGLYLINYTIGDAVGTAKFIKE